MTRLLSPDARRHVTSAAQEARRRGDRRIGTDHLLLGLLEDPNAEAARILGTDLGSARAASSELDRAALAAVGIDVDPWDPEPPGRSRSHPPFTSGARDVLHRASWKLSPSEPGASRTAISCSHWLRETDPTPRLTSSPPWASTPSWCAIVCSVRPPDPVRSHQQPTWPDRIARLVSRRSRTADMGG
jgi:Clp amino terminal domain, pathogenicity island component